MTNILKYDVQSYVREMISKEFGHVNDKEKAHLDNRKLINSEHQKQQKRTTAFEQKKKEWTV